MNDKEKVYKYIDDYFKQIDVNHFLDNKILGRYVDSYLPFYDEYADFNTNAKSYYDYLARYNRILKLYSDLINRLLRRNIEVEDTKTIEFLKYGDWIDNGKCAPDNFDDLIKLLANVKISKGIEEKIFFNIKNYPYKIKNSIKEKDDGIWSPDYTELLEDIDDVIGKIEDRIKDLYEEISRIDLKLEEIEGDISFIENNYNNQNKALQKIINNLYESGSITSNNINNFEFKPDRNIATGNINLFGGKEDGPSFIRTNKDKSENDIVAGV